MCHTYREGNYIADKFANLGVELHSGRSFGPGGIPLEVHSFINRDTLGIPSFRVSIRSFLLFL